MTSKANISSKLQYEVGLRSSTALVFINMTASKLTSCRLHSWHVIQQNPTRLDAAITVTRHRLHKQLSNQPHQPEESDI